MKLASEGVRRNDVAVVRDYVVGNLSSRNGGDGPSGTGGDCAGARDGGGERECGGSGGVNGRQSGLGEPRSFHRRHLSNEQKLQLGISLRL